MQKDGKVIGYARVSTDEQSLDVQVDALEKYGCDHVVQEKASGVRLTRTGLSRALKMVRDGDTFVIWKLDRLGRTLKGLMEAVEELDRRGVSFVSLSDGIETKTIGGKLVFQIMGAIAEFERNVIAERTRAGMDAKKRSGVKFGPDHSIADNPKRLRAWLRLRERGELDRMSDREILAEINKADPKAKPIKALATYKNWRRDGFKGAPPIEDDEPLELAG